MKGILSAVDAKKAVEVGIDGIMVSNHGGKQLDGSVATLDVLPEIADAVAKRTEIIFDGEISRGADVIKAVALGAKAVMIGKPYLYGLASGGETGVDGVLKILRAEIDRAMALTGVTTLSSLNRSYVRFIS